MNLHGYGRGLQPTTSIGDVRLYTCKSVCLETLRSHHILLNRHPLPFTNDPPLVPFLHLLSLRLHSLVGLDKVPEHLRAGGGDDSCIEVRAGSEVVEDTGGDGFGDGLDGFFFLVSHMVTYVLRYLVHGDPRRTW